MKIHMLPRMKRKEDMNSGNETFEPAFNSNSDHKRERTRAWLSTSFLYYESLIVLCVDFFPLPSKLTANKFSPFSIHD